MIHTTPRGSLTVADMDAIIDAVNPRQAAADRAVRSIATQVADAAGLRVDDILSHSQRQPLARLRQIVMFRAHQSGVAYAAIGRALGRDHTTVMHGVRAEAARRSQA